ncbi:hypothetical protein AAU61_07295 [Desulfocarbo indianensis]|nr:hypothetical protein AAU61_07295 [Desulfocarbo indianensis]
MGLTCPFCGTALPEGAGGTGEAPHLCPTCGQEIYQAHEPAERTAQAPPLTAQGEEPRQAGQSAGGEARTDQPADPVSGPTAHTPAWELEGGFWLEKLWKTIWQVLLHPVLTFSAPGRMQKKYSLGLAVIVGTAGNLLSVIWVDLLGDEEAMVVPLVAAVFLVPLGIVIGTFVGACITHLFLMLVRADRGGFPATFRVIGYSQAAQIMQAVPVLGMFASAIWGLVVQVGGLAAAHATTKWRVVASMLLAFALLLAIAVLFAVMVGLGAILPGMITGTGEMQ